MSKIGKLPVAIPAGVTATLDGQTVKVKGPKGALEVTLVEEIAAKIEGSELLISMNGESARHRSMWGLSRTLVANIVDGVTKGFEKKLEITGVGYKAAVQGKISISPSALATMFFMPSRKGFRSLPPSRQKLSLRVWIGSRLVRSPLKSASSVRRSPIRARV